MFILKIYTQLKVCIIIVHDDFDCIFEYYNCVKVSHSNSYSFLLTLDGVPKFAIKKSPNNTVKSPNPIPLTLQTPILHKDKNVHGRTKLIYTDQLQEVLDDLFDVINHNDDDDSDHDNNSDDDINYYDLNNGNNQFVNDITNNEEHVKSSGMKSEKMANQKQNQKFMTNIYDNPPPRFFWIHLHSLQYLPCIASYFDIHDACITGFYDKSAHSTLIESKNGFLLSLCIFRLNNTTPMLSPNERNSSQNYNNSHITDSTSDRCIMSKLYLYVTNGLLLTYEVDVSYHSSSFHATPNNPENPAHNNLTNLRHNIANQNHNNINNIDQHSNIIVNKVMNAIKKSYDNFTKYGIGSIVCELLTEALNVQVGFKFDYITLLFLSVLLNTSYSHTRFYYYIYISPFFYYLL